MKQLDRSKPLINALATISEWLAKQRGLPIVVGIMLIGGGAVLEFINVAVESSAIEMIEVVIRNFGLITALIGILLLEPLGQ